MFRNCQNSFVKIIYKKKRKILNNRIRTETMLVWIKIKKRDGIRNARLDGTFACQENVGGILKQRGNWERNEL